MLRPCALSCLRRAYDFLRTPENGFRRFSAELLEELRTIRGLLMVSSVLDLGAPYLEGAMCGDASMKGCSLSYSSASLDEVEDACRLRERWRFKVLHHDSDDVVDEGGRVKEQYAWVGFGADVAAAAGWELGDIARKDGRPLPRRDRKTELVEAHSIQELPASWSEPTRWKRVVRGAWERAGVIHNLEGRVAVMGLRRICRAAGSHGRRFLTLTDNMAVAMSLDPGRARDYGLNVLAARAASYQLGCNVNWTIRYIRSEANATDFDSRAADRGEIAPGGMERGSARVITRLIEGSCGAGQAAGRLERLPPRLTEASRVPAKDLPRETMRSGDRCVASGSVRLASDDGVGRGEDTARRAHRLSSRPQVCRRSDPPRRPVFLLMIGSAGGPLSLGAQEVGAHVEHVVLNPGDSTEERWAGGIAHRVCRWIQLGRVTDVHLGAACALDRSVPPGLATPLCLVSDLGPICRIVRACDRAGVRWSLDGRGCHRFGRRAASHTPALAACRIGAGLTARAGLPSASSPFPC